MLFGKLHMLTSFRHWCHSLAFDGCQKRSSFRSPRICNFTLLLQSLVLLWFSTIFVKCSQLLRGSFSRPTPLVGSGNLTISYYTTAQPGLAFLRPISLPCVPEICRICRKKELSSNSNRDHNVVFKLLAGTILVQNHIPASTILAHSVLNKT